MFEDTLNNGRVFERVQERYCASINLWCARNSSVSFLSYDYASAKRSGWQTRVDILRDRWKDIEESVIARKRAVVIIDEDSDITNEDMNYDYQGKKILVNGGMDGLFVPIDILYKTAFLNPNLTDLHPITLEDFLSGDVDVFSGAARSYAIMRDGRPFLGLACSSLSNKIKITPDEKIEFSSASMTKLALAFRDVYGVQPVRAFTPSPLRADDECFYENGVKDALFDAIREGAFRFHGTFETELDSKGRFQMPADWLDVCDIERLTMCHDQNTGEICVFFDELLPSQDVLGEEYERIAKKFDAEDYYKVLSALNPYPSLNCFVRPSSKGRVGINPFTHLNHIPSRRLEEPPCRVKLEGFGNGFTIARNDNAWKRTHNAQDPKLRLDIAKYLSLAPVIAHVKKDVNLLLSHERDLIITAHLSSRERNLRDLGFGVSLGAHLPELTEPS